MPQRGKSRWGAYLVSVLTVLVATGLCALIHGWFDLSNLVMIYLAGVVVVSIRFGTGEAVLASILSVALFDLLFVPPRFTFNVADAQYIVTFAVMLAIGLLISTMGYRLRGQAAASQEREQRTAALYRLARTLANSKSQKEIATATVREICRAVGGKAALFSGEEILANSEPGFLELPADRELAQECQRTNTAVSNGAEYLPLRGTTGAVGAIALATDAPLDSSHRELVEAIANTAGAAIERGMLAKESQNAIVMAESEKMRNALLSSISHDLRTPLTSIAGAASALREGAGDAKQLADTIYQEAMRLNLQVQNLLDMTRLQAGGIQLRLEWNSLEEIVGNALRSTRDQLAGRPVEVRLPSDIPLIRVDQELIHKAIENVLENAAVHTPAGSPIAISARLGEDRIYLEIADRGPGIPKGQEARIFERFTRPDESKSDVGFGLGLAICRAVMKLHGGRIWAKNRDDGGAAFIIEILRGQAAPEVPRG